MEVYPFFTWVFTENQLLTDRISICWPSVKPQANTENEEQVQVNTDAEDPAHHLRLQPLPARVITVNGGNLRLLWSEPSHGEPRRPEQMESQWRQVT